MGFNAFLDSIKKINSNALTTTFTTFRQQSGQLKINDNGSSNDISLFLDSIKLIQKAGHRTYTIPVKQANANDVTFRNLIVDVYNGSANTFLATYTPDTTYLRSLIKGLKVPYSGKGKLTPFSLTGTHDLQIQNTGLKTNYLACYTIDVLLYTVFVTCTGQGHTYADSRCLCNNPDEGCTPAYNMEVWGKEDECYDINVSPSGGGGGGGGGTSPAPPPNYDPCPPVAVESSGLKVQKVEGETPCNTPPPYVPPAETLQDKKNQITSILIQTDDYLLPCDSITLLKIAAYQQYGDMYRQVAKFAPSQAVRDRIASLKNLVAPGDLTDFGLQNLNGAFGSVVNSDFFPVRITTLPTGMTMASLTEYFRLHMTDFTSGLATFSPYVDNYVNDIAKFNQAGANSVGALVHIGMMNDGTIVESDYHSDANGTYYKYTTMETPLDYNHPVAGNREFGVYADPAHPGTYTFYTMGVDRVSDWQFAFGTVFFDGFAAADRLWSTMQNNMISYINDHGGHAGHYNKKSYVARPDWNVVKDYLNGTITLQQLKQKIGC